MVWGVRGAGALVPNVACCMWMRARVFDGCSGAGPVARARIRWRLAVEAGAGARATAPGGARQPTDAHQPAYGPVQGAQAERCGASWPAAIGWAVSRALAAAKATFFPCVCVCVLVCVCGGGWLRAPRSVQQRRRQGTQPRPWRRRAPRRRLSPNNCPAWPGCPAPQRPGSCSENRVGAAHACTSTHICVNTRAHQFSLT